MNTTLAPGHPAHQMRRTAIPAEALFRNATRAAAVFVLILLTGVVASLAIGGWQALEHFGPAFLVTEAWNPVTKQFGALVPIFGTLVTSAIAMLFGVPISIGIALFLTELCPQLAAPPARHRDRAARRHPQHHLRHVGPVRVRALLRRHTSSPG